MGGKKNILKLSNKRLGKVFDYATKRKWTIKKFNSVYRKPMWCNYNDALDLRLGCFSLIHLSWNTESQKKELYKNKCNICELSKHYKG